MYKYETTMFGSIRDCDMFTKELKIQV